MSAFTDLALMQFVTIYQEVCPQEKKIDTNELFKLMQEAIKENSLSPSSSRSNSPPRAFVGALAASEASEDIIPRGEGSLSGEGLAKIKGGLIYDAEENGEQVKHKIDLPYAPCIDYSGGCCGIKLVNGMLVPCTTRPQKGKDCCKVCEKNEFKYGKKEDLMNDFSKTGGQWKAPNGKQGITFGTYLMKRGITRPFVEKLIEEFNEKESENLVIPEEQWFVDTTKGKRAVKNVSVSSDTASAEGNEETPKKRRGRPPKNPDAPRKAPKDPNAPKKKRGRPKKTPSVEQENENLDSSEGAHDWLSGMIVDENADQEAEVEAPVAAAVEPAKKEEKKPAKKEPKKEEKKEQAKKEPEKEKPAKKEEKKEPAKKEESENESDNEELEEEEFDFEEDDEEGLDFTPLPDKIDGYYHGYDEENVLYKIDVEDWTPESGELPDSDFLKPVGIWDPEEERPVIS